MKYYAGLDVSQQTTSICIVDDEGKIVAERKVASCPDAIGEALEGLVAKSGLARSVSLNGVRFTLC